MHWTGSIRAAIVSGWRKSTRKRRTSGATKRLVFFFSAMRHFRDQLRDLGWKVDYHELSDDPSQDVGRDFGDVPARRSTVAP
ncbi:MAG: cryptochrome/photolyase family protein [Pirellulaceae bacterium]